MNNVKVILTQGNKQTNLTKYVVSPFKFSNLLDERLDEAMLTLRNVPIAVAGDCFEPLAEITITIQTQPEAKFSKSMANEIAGRSDYDLSGDIEQGIDKNGLSVKLSDNTLTESREISFIVANDSSAETPVGSGLYQHQGYLIERTKLLEGFIGESLTFTNALGNRYGDGATILIPFTSQFGDDPNSAQVYSVFSSPIYGTGTINLPSITEWWKQSMISAYPISVSYDTTGTSNVFTAPTSRFLEMFAPAGKPTPEMVGYRSALWLQSIQVSKAGDSTPIYQYSQEYKTVDNEVVMFIDIYRNGKKVSTKEYKTYPNGIPSILFSGDTVDGLTPGTYYVSYATQISDAIGDQPVSSWDKWHAISIDIPIIITETQVVPDSTKWTITDVIHRLLDCIEPKKQNETNRFTFGQDEKYKNLLAPEFAFTRMTLREELQQIGGFIQAESRLSKDNVITFEEFGGVEQSGIGNRPYVSYQLKSDINDWCTSLDSSADNLVNQLDYAQGVSFEPARKAVGNEDGEFITLRTDSVGVRLSEDNNTFMPTNLPIYKIGEGGKVVITSLPNKGTNNGKGWDITPYVFEKADYDGLLQSTGGEYPYSKSFALYYTQGEKNIRGLFYKQQDAFSPALQNYSILNIIRTVTGDNAYSISGKEYMEIGVTIKYTPVYSTRVRTVKPYLKNSPMPRTIAYNQSANMIESRYYGENLRGVVARLGNIEKTYTYHLAHLTDVPKVGYLFDDTYYISAVSVEVLPTIIKCTVGLSKDFNRLSQYVGISSNKRMWEVSEKQSQERQSIFTEYLKIQDTTPLPPKTAFKGTKKLFNTDKEQSVTNMVATTYTQGGDKIKRVTVPAVASAIGNSLVFTANFADNYSAGEKVESGEYNSSSGTLTGYWGKYVPYGDYYGKFYYLDAAFVNGITANADKWDGKAIPEIDDSITFSAVSNIEKWKYRKDNREIPQISYELAAVTELEKVIIGSGLMRNTPFVNNAPADLVIYGFNRRINRINSKVDLSDGIQLSALTFGTFLNSAYIDIPSEAAQYKAWAIVTKPKTESITVRNDDGTDASQTIHTGGDLVVGANGFYPRAAKLFFFVDTKI